MPFSIALSGLNAASAELRVTGNNIANAATTGFKQSRAEFVDVFAEASNNATGSGVRVADMAQQFSQGSIEFSDRGLDLAISGDGFFIMDDGGSKVYTRAGSFHVDNQGTVINSKDHKLQIFPVISGTIPATFDTGVLQDMSLATTAGAPAPTTTITAGLNLSASAVDPGVAFDRAVPTTYNSSTSVIVYDSLGATHPATMYYVKDDTANNRWETYLYLDSSAVMDRATGALAAQRIEFSPTGTIITPANGIIEYEATAVGTGAANLTLSVDYSNTTQFGGPFGVNSLSQNGFASGRLSGIDVDGEGVVFARFTNGQSSALGKVALANFSNTQGLRQLGDTTWAETFESGNEVLGEPGSGSLGQIQSGALETSNVDIATSLVALITAQRNFQANAQVISTADTITQTIINI